MAVVNQHPIQKKNQGANYTWRDLHDNLLLVPGSNIAPNEAVVYLDDTLTWGKHVWATHARIGCPSVTCAAVIGTTDATKTDAMRARARVISLVNGELKVSDL